MLVSALIPISLHKKHLKLTAKNVAETMRGVKQTRIVVLKDAGKTLTLELEGLFIRQYAYLNQENHEQTEKYLESSTTYGCITVYAECHHFYDIEIFYLVLDALFLPNKLHLEISFYICYTCIQIDRFT